MNELIKRIRVFSLFWATIPFYFLIPFLRSSINCPQWVLYIDQFIPFIGWMVIPYYSYYILIIIPPFIIKDKERLSSLTYTLIKATIFCYIFYILWPISSSDILKQVDVENSFFFLHSSITFDFLNQNAFPSMHVFVSTIIALVLVKELPKFRILFYLSAAGIFFATFLIKQHYVLDSISGLIIAVVAYFLYHK